MNNKLCLLLVSTLVLQLSRNVQSYNLDLLNPLVLGDGSSGSFGYSVAFHSAAAERTRVAELAGSSAPRVFAMVGAPSGTQPGVGGDLTQTGAVYRCSVSFSDKSCIRLGIDISENKNTTLASRDFTAVYGEEKSYMRLGHSLRSVGDKQPFVACAPHYHEVYRAIASEENLPINVTTFWDPVGRCYAMPASLSQASAEAPRVIQPCHTRARFETAQGALFNGIYSCLTGHSVDVSPTGSGGWHVLMGAPTTNYSDGRAFLDKLSNSTEPTAPEMQDSQKLTATPLEQDLTMRFGLAGFSVASGQFSGRSNEVAISAPKINTYQGAVVVTPAEGTDSLLATFNYVRHGSWKASLQDDGKNVVELHSQQFGEFFGFTLTSEDLDGDGISELLVGAPSYTESSGDISAGVASGRVYIYGASLSAALKEKNVRSAKADSFITGPSGSHFGTSIAALGDLDLDGFNDIAIGAPHANNLAGAVYIHYGSAKGLLAESSQILTPAGLGIPDVTSFGWSISKGFDLDNNNYNDILIGAPVSNRAVVLRSRPVVDISVFFSTAGDAGALGISELTADLNNPNCTLNPAIGLTCFKVFVCAQSPYELTPGTPSEIAYSIVVDKNLQSHPDPTARIAPFSNSVTIQTALTPVCQEEIIYIRDDVRYPCHPAMLSVDWKLVDQPSTPERLSPIVRLTTVKNPVTVAINMLGDCTGCVPDLGVIGAEFLTSDGSRDTVIAGETSMATLAVTIDNNGNLLSCLAEVFITLPMGVVFEENVLGNGTCQVDLSYKQATAVRCSLPPVTLPRSTHDFQILLNMKKIVERPKLAKITIRAVSNNTEPNLENNERVLELNVQTQSSVQVIAFSRPIFVDVAKPDVNQPRTIAEVGPKIQHVFQALNLGPSSSPPAQIAISWPIKTRSNVDLLYLTNVESEEKGRVRCNHSSLLDTEQLRQSSEKNGSMFSVVPVLGAASSTAPACDDELCWVTVVCTLPSMSFQASTSVQVTWRVKSKSIVDAALLPYNITSMVTLVGFAQRDDFTWLNEGGNTTADATTYLTGSVERKGSSLKLWHIIVPIVVGLLLIILLILVLWKCGFFKRDTKDFKVLKQEGGSAGPPERRSEV